MWEYKVIKSPGRLSEKELNNYGKESWELVGVLKDFYTKSFGPSSSLACTTYIYYFKKLVE